MQGRWAEANPVTARRLATAGHLVGSHSFYHARMPLFSDRGFRTDVRAAERAIQRIAKVQPRPWFRLPFGAGWDNRRVLRGLDDLGYTPVGWHVDSKDWQIRSNGERVAQAVVDGATATGDGAIVLFHTWPRATLAALPRVIAALRERGAEFVTVGELGPDLPAGPVAPATPVAETVGAE